MRFIRKEYIVTTIYNKEVEKEETILTVLNNLHKHCIEFSLIVKKLFHENFSYVNMSYNKVRISNVNEDNTVNFLVLKKMGFTHINNINFRDIVEINATTMKHNILDTYDDLTRWDILDINLQSDN